MSKNNGEQICIRNESKPIDEDEEEKNGARTKEAKHFQHDYNDVW